MDGNSDREQRCAGKKTIAKMVVVASLAAAGCHGRASGGALAGAATSVQRGALAVVGAALTPHQPLIRWHGRMQAVAIDPTDPNFAIAASESGGAFRTKDGGEQTWTRLDNLLTGRLADVAICRATSPDARILMLTGPFWTGATAQTDHGGLWRSEDDGDSWQRVASFPTPYHGFGIGFQPGTNCEKVFAAASFGLIECSNRGKTCTNVPLPAAIVAVHVRSNGVVDAYTTDGYRRFQRDAAGQPIWSDERNPVGKTNPEALKWLPPTSLDIWGNVQAHGISSSPFDEDVLFALASKTQLVAGVIQQTGPLDAFESDDGGETWTALGLPDNQFIRAPFTATVVSPDHGDDQFDLYAGTDWRPCSKAAIGPLHCADTVGSWANIQPTHMDLPGIVFHPTTHCPLFLASDGGMLKVTTATAPGCRTSWDLTRARMDALQIVEMTGQVHPGSALRTDLFFSTWDNDIWGSRTAGDTWDDLRGAEGGGLSVPHRAPDRLNTLLTGFSGGPPYDAYEVKPGDPSSGTPLGWPDSLGRPYRNGNRKARVVFSCPDSDKDGACDRCVDADGDRKCDVGAGGRPCQDEQGLTLEYAAGTTPLPVCAGVPCIDQANNVNGEVLPDGLCDQIDPGTIKDVPVALPDGRWLDWDPGAMTFAPGASSTCTPFDKSTCIVLKPAQLWLSDVGGVHWTAVPGATLGVVGEPVPGSEQVSWIGHVAQTADGELFFYQVTEVPSTGTFGLIAIDHVTSSASVRRRADVGLPSIAGSNWAIGREPAVAVAPSDPLKLLALVDSGVMRSTDGGRSWTTDAGTAQLTTLIRAGGRLDPRVGAIAFADTNPSRILVAADEGGVIASGDAGQSWARLCRSDRVPFVSDFFFDEAESQIYLASYGRGMWTVDPTQQQIPAFTTPPPDVTVLDCGPVDIGQAQAADQCEPDPSLVSVTVTAAPNAVSGDPDFGCQTGQRPCGDFQRGTRAVEWTAVDQYGDRAATTSTVTVNDRTPPVISPVSDITVTACNTAGEPIRVAVPTAVDRCVGAVTVTGQVVASTTASVPRNVVNGQVTLPAGVHTIRWTASDGITSSSVTQVVTVRPGIFANRDLELRDRARTTLASGAAAAVSNRGGALTQIGSDATSGDILSVARVDLRDRAHVQGSITSQGSVTRGNQTTVTGTIRANTPVALPPFPTLGSVTYPPPVGSDRFANPGAPLVLAPGSYRNVTVNSGGMLTLSTGDYFFTGLTANSAGVVRINDSAGPVRVFVQTTLAYRSSFVHSNGTLADVFLGYSGNQSVVIEAHFLGTFIAPNATVEMGTGNAFAVRGRFAALTLIVRPDTNLVCVSSFAATL